MKIEILGTGCAKCKKLYEVAVAAVAESGASGVELLKIEKLADIVNYGVMITPAIAFDGVVKTAGRVPSKEEIKKWILGF